MSYIQNCQKNLEFDILCKTHPENLEFKKLRTKIIKNLEFKKCLHEK